MLDLTARFEAYWDETQEHRVLINQDVEALRADVRTVLANQATILCNQQSLQDQLTQILTLLPAPTVVIRPITKEVSYTLSRSFIDIADNVNTYLGGGGGGVGGDRVW